ncbi:FG-GAP-like repeat-containing protein [Microbacterium sp. DT81.1]|uniref:FG-GAP-like repeat-containing protein n=1 Tax=Microbacterium sp. DT81.1 TaxID=3393413 RepID=UPI003CF92347
MGDLVAPTSELLLVGTAEARRELSRRQSRRTPRLLAILASAALALAIGAVAPAAAVAAGPMPIWRLPFEDGQRWKAGAPHSSAGNNTGPRGSLDLGPSAGAGSRVVSIAAGTVYKVTCSGNFYLGVDHGNGWQSTYYHLANQQSGLVGSHVPAGTYLGDAARATPCGGSATFDHVHLSIQRDGAAVDISGFALGAYRVYSSGNDYHGYWNGLDGSRAVTNTGLAVCCLTGSGSSSGNSSTAVTDFTGDGTSDIAWYEAWNNGGAVQMLSSTGTGFSGSQWLAGYSKPDWAAAGDFNGDGKSDLAWYEGWNSGTTRILTSNGAGFPSSYAGFSGYSQPDWAGTGDFNGDGKTDIAWYEAWNDGAIQILLSTGTGFSGSRWVSGYGKPDWAATGDFDGDGKSDVAWYEAWNNGGAVQILKSTGSGFSGSQWLAGYGKPDWAATGDFSGDGKSDIAWYEAWNSGGAVQMLSSTGSAFSSSQWLAGYSKPDWAAAGDFNGDGKSDLAWYEGWNSGITRILTSNGAGFPSSYEGFSGYGQPDWANGVQSLSAISIPTISGNAQLGQSLTANAGVWGPDPVNRAFTWLRDGRPIAGATVATYKLVAADAGAAITVTVTASKTGYITTSRTSTPKTVAKMAFTAAPAPTVTGTATVGSTLTAIPGTWSPIPTTLTYQWKRAQVAIPGATAATYKLVAADAGAAITVTVTASKTGYITTSRTSTAKTVR